MNRRDFLADLGRVSFLCAGIPNDWRVFSMQRAAGDPFTLGVASGDPTSTDVVIWTRLAPRPLDPDGGMIARTAVNWEVAEDEGFKQIAQRGRYTAAPELGFSVHADVRGLAPGREYFYRFTVPDGSSPVGRLRTAPAPGPGTPPLRLAFASCQHFEQGYFTAYDHLAREGAHLVAHLGDYIYEYGGAERVRKYATSEIRTIDQYRARYAQTKGDASLMAAHAAASWIVTWDDHEVDNNYAGLSGENDMESDEQMRLRRAIAYQAWWEHMPVRVPRVTSWADLNITRRIQWGSLAGIWMLDTRQYRNNQACDDGNRDVPCGDWNDPARTMLGPAQEQWLFDGLAEPGNQWQVLANQVRIAPFDETPGDGRRFSMDHWSGYPLALERLSRAIAERAPNRTVAITGDIHSNWVNELRASHDRPDAPVIGAEFIGTSISSGGDGRDEGTNWNDKTRAENPHCKWHNARRGYVVCDFTAEDCRASYRTIPYVTKTAAPVATASAWRVVRGRPGIERI